MIFTTFVLCLLLSIGLCQETYYFSDQVDTTLSPTTAIVSNSNNDNDNYHHPTSDRKYYFDTLHIYDYEKENHKYTVGYPIYACPERKRKRLVDCGYDYEYYRGDAYYTMLCAAILLPLICMLGVCFTIAAWFNGNVSGASNYAVTVQPPTLGKTVTTYYFVYHHWFEAK
jgi:hypothetical protein